MLNLTPPLKPYSMASEAGFTEYTLECGVCKVMISLRLGQDMPGMCYSTPSAARIPRSSGVHRGEFSEPVDSWAEVTRDDSTP